MCDMQTDFCLTGQINKMICAHPAGQGQKIHQELIYKHMNKTTIYQPLWALTGLIIQFSMKEIPQIAQINFLMRSLKVFFCFFFNNFFAFV